ncbi:hypothetical protein ACFXKW_08145 [Streptomyces sp. NPDC059193]|uniref:hypothetical protein n=1 Tax=Streptomyces sp. NPDC059193 TaxID=3346763 RepID=UPI0036CC052A
MTEADGTTATVTASRPDTAWPLENILFSTALVARRLPWADLPARVLGLDALTLDGLTHRLMAHLRGGRDGRPVRLRTPFGTFLVPLTRADAENLLTRADAAGALGPADGLAADGLRYALSPHAAPEGAWDVLTRDERDGLTAQVARHLVDLRGARREDGTTDPDRRRAAMLRLSRQVVLGAAASEDTLLSELVTEAGATGATGGRTYGASRAAAVRRRLAPYVAAPEPGSLADRLAARGRDGDPDIHEAVAHALALVSAATGAPALRALELLGAGTAGTGADSDEEAAAEAVEQALDRYPPLSAVVYPVRAPLGADGVALAAGDEILYLPTLLGPATEGGPTDPARALCADPAGCALARFAALVCREVVRGIAAEVRPADLAPRFTGRAVAAPLSEYGVRGRVGADRLERHAESLAACAADTGWNGSEAGERFRMVLLAHAERCSRAAADVRSAAGRLSD